MISVGIVAHHSRYERAKKLSDIVNAEVITVDQNGKLGAGANHELCYEWLADSDQQWSVILEDDALPCKGFLDQLGQVLLSSPTDVLSLYLGRTRPPHWQPSIAKVIGGDHHYLIGSELLHHVAVAIRTPLIRSVLNYFDTDTAYRRGKLPIDEAVGKFCRTNGIKVGYTHPSICNHDARLPTVIDRHVSQHKGEKGSRNGGPPRQAWAFGSRSAWQPITAVIPEPARP